MSSKVSLSKVLVHVLTEVCLWMKLLVLTDTVEDNHCIVDSVTDDSQDRSDECLVDIKAEWKDS